ncbi:MAG: shikimate kinase [Alphaproteobacteria bacterium]
MKKKPPQDFALDRPVVLIGMMGAGKSTIGLRAAGLLDVPFYDADKEIEKAADMTIPEIFETFGEAHFRDGERRVIARLLEGKPSVIATGGGAFMDPETRSLIAENALSVWLRAEETLLWSRVSRRSSRPLLQTDNPRQTLNNLIADRYPVYAEADLVVESKDVSKEAMAGALVAAVRERLGQGQKHEGKPGE